MTTPKTGRTPGPWRFTYLPASEIGICADGIGLIQSLGYAGDADGEIKEANARYMVDCVNSHDTLTAKCAAMENVLRIVAREACLNQVTGNTCYCYVCMAQDALLAGKGE